MIDIIRLLPDSVANQIAAGEVVQRPASAVKELLENAIDAGATHIDLILKDAGKLLIQVIDNGCGMSETDARMSFERHATSKISKAEDLFSIRTMGFRGEALASIAAIAQVEMKTRRQEDELGTLLRIEGSDLIEQELCSTASGTSIAVKNLFFNVPARRNFLKSTQAELKHVMDEFYRVSLINPAVGFSLTHNDKELFHLGGGSFKQRIVALFGTAFNERLLPVNMSTEKIGIEGFIGKAAFAKKTRGEQYFFVNNRFIKHHYLHHAVENAFHELLPKETFPTYFLHISIDTAEIDINIHPTKTEVNFQDTRMVYALIQAAVRKSLGQHDLSPRIDFDVPNDLGIDFGEISKANRPVTPPSITVNPGYNPFSNPRPATENVFRPASDEKDLQERWRLFYQQEPEQKSEIIESGLHTQPKAAEAFPKKVMQVQGRYILTTVKSGLMLIDQHLAHTRILFEKYLKQLHDKKNHSQQLLFPVHIHLNASDAAVLTEMMGELRAIGFSIDAVGDRTFVVSGTPDGAETDLQQIVEQMLEDIKNQKNNLQAEKNFTLAKSLAMQFAIRHGQQLSDMEIHALIDQLFACQVADVAPDGRPILKVLSLETLSSLLR